VEYEALGEDFRTRGRRSEEQIGLLRLLWTQEVVTYSRKWRQISHAGLNPQPIQRPIPIWIGSDAPQTPLPPEAGMRRIARLADGWFPLFDLNDQGKAVIARIRQYAADAGRDPDTLGLEGRVSLAGTGPDNWRKTVQAWKAVDATHLSVSTGGKALQTPQEHPDAIRRFKNEVGL
jgi:alkanesulfonate monooxygenase SsuD/methylene tetrahydromethanopterin reductase-like flavin-dependent oxidoreductase (luciferase family)